MTSFIITDNGSVDGTADIIGDYVRAGLAEMILEPDDTYSQGRWVTRMARLAATRHGADWVINSDDDEFWFARHSDLKQGFVQLPAATVAIEATRRNHPPLRGPSGLGALNAMIYRESSSFTPLLTPLPPKVAHRAMADVEVAQGNHAIARDGVPLPAAPTDAIEISHFPVRGYPAFARKIELGGAAYARNTELDPEVGLTWRWLHELLNRNRLRDWYDQQLLAPDQAMQRLEDGSLVIDEFVARALDKLPDAKCANAV